MRRGPTAQRRDDGGGEASDEGGGDRDVRGGGGVVDRVGRQDGVGGVGVGVVAWWDGEFDGTTEAEMVEEVDAERAAFEHASAREMLQAEGGECHFVGEHGDVAGAGQSGADGVEEGFDAGGGRGEENAAGLGPSGGVVFGGRGGGRGGCVGIVSEFDEAEVGVGGEEGEEFVGGGGELGFGGVELAAAHGDGAEGGGAGREREDDGDAGAGFGGGSGEASGADRVAEGGGGASRGGGRRGDRAASGGRARRPRPRRRRRWRERA